MSAYWKRGIVWYWACIFLLSLAKLEHFGRNGICLKWNTGSMARHTHKHTYTTREYIFPVHFMITQLICFLFTSCDIYIVISDANDEWNMIQNVCCIKCMLKSCKNGSLGKRNCNAFVLNVNNDARQTKKKIQHRDGKNLKYVTFIIIFFLLNFQFRFSSVFPFSAHCLCTAIPHIHFIIYMCMCVVVVDFQDLFLRSADKLISTHNHLMLPMFPGSFVILLRSLFTFVSNFT